MKYSHLNCTATKNRYVVSEQKVFKIYQILYNHYGKQNWWPADSDFEIMIGAVLTQNTAWRNVEKAINNLKEKKLLNPQKLATLSISKLSQLVRSSGFYRIKAKRLKSLLNFLTKKYSGDIEKLKRKKISILRLELLQVYGIGEETADSILLYAIGKPVFVVDAYTKRIFSRHHYFDKKTSYSKIQEFFAGNLPKSLKIYQEYHALLVRLAKDYCRSKANCQGCPIKLL